MSIKKVILNSIDRRKLRNIGIIAHINAGKTTTTERILYNSGSTEIVGDVDEGTTVTDYLKQERERGITITSAAVSYNWNGHRINLLDTPGHVDFTVEVERSLSVMDGVVTILDASAGVEAQTITVWSQASRFSLPNVIFLNKYDKPQADYRACLQQLKQDLNIKPLLLQLPIKEHGDQFLSILDVVKRQILKWPKDCETSRSKQFVTQANNDYDLSREYCDLLEEEREKLVNVLSDHDDELADHVLNCEKISQVHSDILERSIARASSKAMFSPVLLGSSFKYIGVQPLMDAIISYLPSPVEREAQIKSLLAIGEDSIKRDQNCAFIFKTTHDKRLGDLAFVRVCNGSISKLQRLSNLSSGKEEQVKKVYRIFADEVQELEEPAEKDDIVALTGISVSRTSEILVDPNVRYDEDSLTNDLQPFKLLNGHIIVPRIANIEPVYYCSIEAYKESEQDKLEKALANLARDDPSLTYESDDLGMYTIRGMGKLHLEVLRDRLETEHKVNSVLGPLQISYRESIDGCANEQLEWNRTINGIKSLVKIGVYIRSKKGLGLWSPKMLRLDNSPDSPLTRLRNDHKKAIENGFASALSSGPLIGCHVVDCDVLLMVFEANSRCALPVISAAASQCLTNAIRKCSPQILEPIMTLEVTTPREFNSHIQSDISSRRGIVINTTARGDQGKIMIIRSHTPLASLGNYSEYLRILTSGRASFSMELHSKFDKILAIYIWHSYKNMPETYKSWVASRFILIEHCGVQKRRCRHQSCGKEYSRGTSHMILKRHWSKEHGVPSDELNSNTRKKTFTCPTSGASVGSGPAGANIITTSGETSTRKNLTNSSHSPQKSRAKIVADNSRSNSSPTTHNLSKDDRGSLDVKLVSKRLKEATSIHLSFDIYTAKKAAKSHGIVTAHSLSESKDIKSVILEYRHLPFPDDPTAITEFLRSCIQQFNIREKIISIASGCTASVTHSIQEIDRRLKISKNFNFSTSNIKCFPQFVHLNVIEIFRSQDDLIDNVRKVVAFINNNNFTLQPLQPNNTPTTVIADSNQNNNPTANNNPEKTGLIDSSAKATGLRLPTDNKNSWNTTFIMIDTFVHQRGFIEPTLMYFQDSQNLAVSIDWDRLYNLYQMLKPFYDTIAWFSEDNFAPVSVVATVLPHLINHLSDPAWESNDLATPALNFKSELESYRQNFHNDLTIIAGLLDPRTKDSFLAPEARENALDMLRRRLDSQILVKNEVQDQNQQTTSIFSDIFRSRSFDEVTDYMSEPRLPRKTDVITYWDSQKTVFPGLYSLARALIVVQATSVPSERMFSAAENLDRTKKTQFDGAPSKELQKSWARYLEK